MQIEENQLSWYELGQYLGCLPATDFTVFKVVVLFKQCYIWTDPARRVQLSEMVLSCDKHKPPNVM